ncbi:MAG: DUF3108 domain-containing protein [Prevotella sp.]|nr:DUF3108 domain-containing protein [Prevotella sp.]
MKRFRIMMMMLLLLAATNHASAQCTFHNTAFKSGEFLSYNLYFNWKFVWVKAGTASFSIVQSVYNGSPAYRGSLITRSSNRVDKMFIMRDTLLCYNSLDLAPLYYRKGAREGSRYTVDEVFYNYPNGKCQIRQHRLRHDGRNAWEKHVFNDCIYDMMSIFLRARSFNPTGWKSGYDVNFPMADGNSVNPAKLRFEGKVNIKADNGHTYRCLQLSYMENENNEGFKKIVDFYVTDDANHIPVRLDMHLKFGSAKAFLVGMKGIRSAVNAQVK